MNILLASVQTLPKLVEGKVCVITNDTYALYKPSRYCTIMDDFNPLNYSILISDRFPKCIIYSSARDREHYLVNSQLRCEPIIPYRIGDIIHIHSRRGCYEIVDILHDAIRITCKKWQYTNTPTMLVLKTDFQCLAGGTKNYNF